MSEYTEKQLLEWAAKAAGYDVRWHEIWRCFVHVSPLNNESPPTPAGYRIVWAPLDDDGDALRLAVKLSISIDVNGMFVNADCRHRKDDIGYFEENSARNSGDIMQTARLAILRGAAEIGRAMP